MCPSRVRRLAITGFWKIGVDHPHEIEGFDREAALTPH
jgi:hypothetical protein